MPIEEATTAVARGAEGLHRRRRAARGRQRDRVDLLLRRGRSRSIRTSRSPTRRCRASTAASARPAASEEYARLAYEHSGTVQRARAAVHPVPVPRPRDRRSAQGARSARSLEADVSAGLPPEQRAGRAAQPARRLRPVDRSRRRTRCGSIPRTRFPYSNLAYALRGAGRYAEAKRTGDEGGGAGHRDHADPPPALSAGGPGRQRTPRRSSTSTGRAASRASSTSPARRPRSPRSSGRMAEARALYRADDRPKPAATRWPRSPAATSGSWP